MDELPPQNVVYGLWREETFAVLDAEWAARAAAELDQWKRATTIGEASHLIGATPILGSPVSDDAEEFDEDSDDYDSSHTFRLNECGCVREGDWPPMPASLSWRFLPRDFPLGGLVTTVMNGDYLYIDPDDEEDLVNYLREHGCSVKRDDNLINFLGLWP